MQNENVLTEDDIVEIIQEIYVTCDVFSSNNVPTSKLINFMDNLGVKYELTDLKKKLDPEDDDPNISSENFIKIMKEWVHNFNLDLSVLSKERCYIIEDSVHNTSDNGNQERIKVLEHKNDQLCSELEYIKAHFVALEEEHGSNQSNVEKHSENLLEKEKLNNELLLLTKRCCEMSEQFVKFEKENFQLKKALSASNKKNSLLRENIQNIEDEKQRLEGKLNLITRREDAKIQLIRDLEIELQEKEIKIQSLLENNSQLELLLIEHEQNLTHYKESNLVLKDEMVKLEHCVQEYQLRFCILKTSITPLKTPSLKGKVSDHRILKQILDFNSPKLLTSLANPVSPNLCSPPYCKDPDANSISSSPVEFSFSEVTCENDSFVIPNDLDSFCNNNELNLQINLSYQNNLGDEMLLADEDFHKNECQNIIKNQKTEIADLNCELKESYDKIQNMKCEIECLKISKADTEIKNNTLNVDNQKLLSDFSEEVKTKDKLHEELVLLRGRIGDCKKSNFNKLETKLEKREARIDVLEHLLKQEKNLSQKLNCQKEDLVNEKNVVEGKLKIILNKTSVWNDDVSKRKLELYRIKKDCVHLYTFLKNSLGNVNERLNRLDVPIQNTPSTESNANADKDQRNKPNTTKRIFCYFLLLIMIIVFVGFVLFLRHSNALLYLYVKKSYLDLPPT